MRIIDLNSRERHQSVMGFGGALTDACEANLDGMSPFQRQAFMNRVFSPGIGAGFNYIRIPLGGNDYSSGDYTMDDSPDGKPDVNLKYYDFSKVKKLIATLKEAKRLNPDLQLMMTPWTAPAWMKSPAHLKGGTLKPEYYQAYAQYLVRSLEEFASQGAPIDYFSILNEPDNTYANTDWNYPQMEMKPNEQFEFIFRYLVPLLEKEKSLGKTNANILLHDHNWDLAQGMEELLQNSKIKEQTAGVAFHCYSGTPADMSTALAHHPDTPRILTECTSLIQQERDSSVFQYWSKNFLIEGARENLAGAVGWNLCLDPEGSPRNPDSHGCPNCRGLMTVQHDGKFEPNQEFLALEQISRFVSRGAVRIGSTDLKLQQLPNVAFQNPDGSRVLSLRNDSSQDVTVTIRDEKLWTTQILVPAAGAVTAHWH